MALSDQAITLAGLCEIVLPSRTVRLCDGALLSWGGNSYTTEDAEFGVIESIDAVTEAVSDEAPSGKMTMLPPEGVDAADLVQPDVQGSAMRFWLAEVNQATGAVVGTPELLFSGFLDTITLRSGRTRRAVEIEFISEAERLFHVKEGNVLSSRFHQLAWPGELGFDHATGVPALVPWGVPGPGRGTISSGSLLSSPDRSITPGFNSGPSN
jgi:hypothetical protein